MIFDETQKGKLDNLQKFILSISNINIYDGTVNKIVIARDEEFYYVVIHVNNNIFMISMNNFTEEELSVFKNISLDGNVLYYGEEPIITIDEGQADLIYSITNINYNTIDYSSNEVSNKNIMYELFYAITDIDLKSLINNSSTPNIDTMSKYMLKSSVFTDNEIDNISDSIISNFVVLEIGDNYE